MRVPLAVAAFLGITVSLGTWSAHVSAAEQAPAAPPPVVPAPEAPGPLLLRTAVARGLLEAKAHSPTSYTSVRLDLTNPGKEAVTVDLCGSFVRPRGTRPCQRLGLGPVITPGDAPTPPLGSTVVVVPPATTLGLHVSTVCLDAGVNAPTNQSFLVAAEGLPEVRERVMRWWAAHPRAPQGVVNSSIWRNVPDVDGSFSEELPQREFPALRGAWRGGTTYLLRRGALVARDVDGVERFLATQVVDVFPADGALYALADVRGALELWRYVETGDELWKRIAPVPEGMDIRRVEPLPGGGVLVATPTRLLRVAPGRSVMDVAVLLPPSAERYSYRVLPDQRLRMSVDLPYSAGVFKAGEQEHSPSARSEMWLHDLTRPDPTPEIKRYWRVATVEQGLGGTYALTDDGRLRVLRGESFRDVPGPEDLARILHVGREHLWARTGFGALVTVRLESGAVGLVVGSLTGLDGLRFDDPVHATAMRGDALVRLDPDTGETVVLQWAPSPARN